jgi:hypothetical protein
MRVQHVLVPYECFISHKYSLHMISIAKLVCAPIPHECHRRVKSPCVLILRERHDEVNYSIDVSIDMYPYLFDMSAAVMLIIHVCSLEHSHKRRSHAKVRTTGSEYGIAIEYLWVLIPHESSQVTYSIIATIQAGGYFICLLNAHGRRDRDNYSSNATIRIECYIITHHVCVLTSHGWNSQVNYSISVTIRQEHRITVDYGCVLILISQWWHVQVDYSVNATIQAE